MVRKCAAASVTGSIVPQEQARACLRHLLREAVVVPARSNGQELPLRIEHQRQRITLPWRQSRVLQQLLDRAMVSAKTQALATSAWPDKESGRRGQGRLEREYARSIRQWQRCHAIPCQRPVGRCAQGAAIAVQTIAIPPQARAMPCEYRRGIASCIHQFRHKSRPDARRWAWQAVGIQPRPHESARECGR